MAFFSTTVVSEKHLRLTGTIFAGVVKIRGSKEKRRLHRIIIPSGGTQEILVGDKETGDILQVQDFRRRDNHPGGVRIFDRNTGEIYTIDCGGFENIHGVRVRHREY